MAATATAKRTAARSAAARRVAGTRRSAPARTATARSAAARTAPAKRPAATPRPRRRQNTPVTGFVPVAVRTAGAVGGLADSGVVMRMARGRIWIGLLATLLVGIVALNVMALSFSASSSDAARQADALKRQNSAYRAEIATLTSSEEVQETAGRLGLHVPGPDEIGYLQPSPDDAAKAAKRLRAGELSTAEYVAPETLVVPVSPTEAAPVAEPVAVDPAVPVATDPAATVPAPAPAPVAPPAAISGGGVSSP